MALLAIAGTIRLPSDSDSDDNPVLEHSKTPPTDHNATRYETRDSDFGLSSGEDESTPFRPRGRAGRAGRAGRTKVSLESRLLFL